jgi:hypothetical protein
LWVWGYWLSPFMGAFVIDYDNQQLRFFWVWGILVVFPSWEPTID